MDELLDAVEWELLSVHDADTDAYDLVSVGPRGNVRSYPISTIRPGAVVVFGFEDFDGVRKVLLIDVFISIARSEEP
ncbi:MAG TPA: hypothetical protein VGM88_10050 [Kofleriaceae bacterium]